MYKHIQTKYKYPGIPSTPRPSDGDKFPKSGST